MSATPTQTEPSTPTWPSLYDPLVELHDLEHHVPIQPGGRYLKHAGGLTCFPVNYTATDSAFGFVQMYSASHFTGR